MPSRIPFGIYKPASIGFSNVETNFFSLTKLFSRTLFLIGQ